MFDRLLEDVQGFFAEIVKVLQELIAFLSGLVPVFGGE